MLDVETNLYSVNFGFQFSSHHARTYQINATYSVDICLFLDVGYFMILFLDVRFFVEKLFWDVEM